MSAIPPRALGRRDGLECALDGLERAAALPVLPGHEDGWLRPVLRRMEALEHVWSQEHRREERGRLRRAARRVARREEQLLHELTALRTEASRSSRKRCEALRERVLACSAGARHVLDALRKLTRRHGRVQRPETRARAHRS